MDSTPQNIVSSDPNGTGSAVGSPTSGVRGPNAPAGQEVDRQSNRESSTERPAVATTAPSAVEIKLLELVELLRVERLQAVPSKTLQLMLPIMTNLTSTIVPHTLNQKALLDAIHAPSQALAPNTEVPIQMYPIETRSQASASDELGFATPRGADP